MIPVTRTFLPPLTEFTARLEHIWTSGWITNNGAQVKELAEGLRKWLGIDNLALVANGTLALQLAIRALDLEGEIITSPYSYVASVTSILWEGCTPVFVDVDEDTFGIDATKIEAAVTPRTSAILATHVYGYPCDVEGIERVARRHRLRVIYDAAHAFGVKLKGRSVLEWGDISALSFHATKPFHTAEGGALVARDAALVDRVELLRAFGHRGEEDYFCAGINAKMSELHAALGLCVLPHFGKIVEARRATSTLYDGLLAGTSVRTFAPSPDIDYNYAYYPVLFNSQKAMLRARSALLQVGIAPRRYFHPSLNRLPYLAEELQRDCPVSESIASRVLCLPLFASLEPAETERTARIVRTAL